MSLEDDLARMRAETDQSVEGMKEVARGLAAMYGELIEQGLPGDHALALTQHTLSEQFRQLTAAQAKNQTEEMMEMVRRLLGGDGA